MLRTFGLSARRKPPAPSFFVRLIGFTCATVVALVIVGLTTDKLSQAAGDFLMKRSGARDVSRAFKAASRGDGIASAVGALPQQAANRQWGSAYIRTDDFPAGVAMWGDIPISAPVEKDRPHCNPSRKPVLSADSTFLPAHLHARGMDLRRRGDPRVMALLGACIGVVNVGEAVILAPRRHRLARLGTGRLGKRRRFVAGDSLVI